MFKMLQWWLIINAFIVLMFLIRLLPPIPWTRRKQLELNVMMTLKMMRVRDGWQLVADKEYPHTIRIKRRYKLVQVPIERALAKEVHA